MSVGIWGKSIEVGNFRLTFWSPGYEEPPPPVEDRTPLWYPGSLGAVYKRGNGDYWGAYICFLPPSIGWPQRVA